MNFKIFLQILVLNSLLCAQDFFDNVSLYFNYTNTSKLFLQPKSADPIVRAAYNELRDIYSLSGEIRIQLFESLSCGLWIEYMKKTFTNKNVNLGSFSADVKDGYIIFPVEISIYYFLPFSTEKFKFYMGGGLGTYFADHIRKVGNVTSVRNGINFGYGIQVSVTVDYKLHEFIFVRSQMRFRDPEIEMRNKYSNNYVTYENRMYRIYKQDFNTKVNVDGITFSIGIGVVL